MKLEDISNLENLLNKDVSTLNGDGTESRPSRLDSRVKGKFMFIVCNSSLSRSEQPSKGFPLLNHAWLIYLMEMIRFQLLLGE